MSRSRTTNFAFNLYNSLINFKQYFLFLQRLKSYVDVKRILSIKSISSCNIFREQED